MILSLGDLENALLAARYVDLVDENNNRSRFYPGQFLELVKKLKEYQKAYPHHEYKEFRIGEKDEYCTGIGGSDWSDGPRYK